MNECIYGKDTGEFTEFKRIFQELEQQDWHPGLRSRFLPSALFLSSVHSPGLAMGWGTRALAAHVPHFFTLRTPEWQRCV